MRSPPFDPQTWLAALRRPVLFGLAGDAASSLKGLDKHFLRLEAQAHNTGGAAAELASGLAREASGWDNWDLAERRAFLQKTLHRLDTYEPADNDATSAPELTEAEPKPPAPSPRREPKRRTDEGLVPTDPVTRIPGAGPKSAAALAAAGFTTVGDILRRFPREYHDFRELKGAALLVPGEAAAFMARVTRPASRFRQMVRAEVNCEGVRLKLRWFRVRAGYAQELCALLTPGRDVFVSGKLTGRDANLAMAHPVVSAEPKAGLTGIRPVYPAIDIVSGRRFGQIAARVLDAVDPHALSGLVEGAAVSGPEILQALRTIHTPPPTVDLRVLHAQQHPHQLLFARAEARCLQLGILIRRRHLSTQTAPRLEGAWRTDGFGFELTTGQREAIAAIAADLRRGHPMHRLLMGDVGSGKTAVAAAAMFAVAEAGFQAALMTPTELLAEQQVQVLRRWLGPGRTAEAELVTGSQSAAGRSRSVRRLRQGAARIAVGTHALFQEGVEFENLALCVVDEQHRFGVEQRARLAKKGEAPHVLFMTATPIPRSLTLTLYGDLDVSLLRERPSGRRSPPAEVLWEHGRETALAAARAEIATGHQVFWVCPLIEASDEIDAADAKSTYETVRAALGPTVPVGLLHGRMAAPEKDRAMRAFAAGRTQVLVATTVIEVGIDVPNATLMIIESAERFGLAQLHQLRGRVGRGGAAGRCLLIPGAGSRDEARGRLDVFRLHDDGFALAEKDLELRGPGDFLGVRQAGVPMFEHLNPLRHRRLIDEALPWAQTVLEADPGLANPQHAALREAVMRRFPDTGLTAAG